MNHSFFMSLLLFKHAVILFLLVVVPSARVQVVSIKAEYPGSLLFAMYAMM
tara:strand:- start:43 stop:195 length:153 start_codon:yes stop_codon:yes gene_type:complete